MGVGAGDIYGNGRIDLVVAGRSGPVVVVVDLDRDGRTDAVITPAEKVDQSGVEVLRNNGTGALWPVEIVDTVGSHNMQAADVDRDWDMDLFGADFDSGDAPDGPPLRLWRNGAMPVPEPGLCPRWSPVWRSWRGGARERGDAAQAAELAASSSGAAAPTSGSLAV